MPPETVLAVRGLTKRFEGILALSRVSFDVRRGEVFGVIGPNGAGKTTLFSCLVGAVVPTAGEVLFLGRRIDRLRCHQVAQRGLVRTHQVVRPFREMSVAENVSVAARFGRGRRRGAEADRKVREVLERTGLSHRAPVPARTLTIGELKRLEVARALAAEPEVVCLDEVMGGLNPTEIREAVALVRSVRDAGVTVLMIEHHVHAVAGVCDRILVLNFGEVIAEGVPKEVLSHPAVVTAYLGSDAPDLLAGDA